MYFEEETIRELGFLLDTIKKDVKALGNLEVIDLSVNLEMKRFGNIELLVKKGFNYHLVVEGIIFSKLKNETGAISKKVVNELINLINN